PIETEPLDIRKWRTASVSHEGNLWLLPARNSRNLHHPRPILLSVRVAEKTHFASCVTRNSMDDHVFIARSKSSFARISPIVNGGIDLRDVHPIDARANCALLGREANNRND